MKEEDKDLNYWKENAKDAYMTTPICVLRYITELEKAVKNNAILPHVSGSASFDTVKRIWNAAENYTMHELGEICKGDAAYCEDVPDLDTYFERHYR